MSESSVQIKFGTDGWRAIIAREFTFANVERVAQAYADLLTREAASESKPFVVIGCDRRFLSEKFAARTAEVMVANGFGIALFTEAEPTPLISWAVKDLGATGVWLTPVYRNSLPGPNPSGAYHGYSTVDFYDVEPRFGTMKEFKELVDEAHRLGLKIVQDQVANHSGPRHPWVADSPVKTWFNYLDQTPRPRNNFEAFLCDKHPR